MANVRITDLSFIPQLAPEDLLVIDDVSELVTHKLSLANLITFTGNAYAVADDLDAYAESTNAILANTSSNLSLSTDSSASNIIVGQDLLSLLGDGAVLTAVASNVITLSLSETGVGANTYGAVSGEILELPSITVDSQGRITDVSLLSYTSGAAAVEARRASNTFYTYDGVTVSSNAHVVPSASQNLGAESTRWSNVYASTLDIGETRIREYTTYGVSSAGAIIFSEPVTDFNFVKLLINIEDITYGQFQTSELLLIHDSNLVRTTEYAIVHTSTAPIMNYSAAINGSNVELQAATQSANNTVKVLAFKN